jgi:hypothetical protein
MFDLIAQAFINLGTFLQQTTTGASDIDNLVSIVIAIASIAGVIGAFLKMVPGFRKYGIMIDTFSQKGVENEEMVRRVAAATAEMFPEMKEVLKKHGAELEYLAERTTKGAGQLDLLKAQTLGQKSRANTVAMPRESKKVF